MRHLGRRLRLALVLGVLLLFAACKKNPVGPEVTPNVQLSLDYVACTEVWLKLAFADSPSGGDYRITRDGTTVLSGTISGSSAVLYDTTAQANKSYSYTAYRVVDGKDKQISPTLPVTTLDSTSNNFTWQTFSFGGDAGSCLLHDVTIVSDTDIWAVGAVYLKDSAGNPDPQPYNLVKWYGSSWTLQRVPYHY